MTDAAPDRTLFQFSLRSLFVATVVVAFLSAIAAPWLHGLSGAQLTCLGILLGVPVLVASAYLAVLCVCRWNVEREGGKLLLKTSSESRSWLSVLNLSALVAGLAAGFFVALISVVKSDGFGAAVLFVPAFAGGAIAVVSYVVVNLRWQLGPTSLEARENGLVFGGFRFLPWARIHAHGWEGLTHSNLTLHLKHEVVNVRLDLLDKEAFDRLLHDKQGGHGRSVPAELAGR